jgi:ribosomal protein S18 acetylase RimI-like enzyme
VTELEQIRFRRASSLDSERIAYLHADSWRRHYRGAYSDSFLDGDVARDRLAVWAGRLTAPDAGCCTIVAEQRGALVGFAHTRFEDDTTWGALLDNLHVAHAHQRGGIGSQLVAATAAALVDERPGSALYLWVLEQNRAAQAFYAALGGRCVEQAVVEPPGGDPSRLRGTPRKLRYSWSPAAVVTLPVTLTAGRNNGS